MINGIALMLVAVPVVSGQQSQATSAPSASQASRTTPIIRAPIALYRTLQAYGPHRSARTRRLSSSRNFGRISGASCESDTRRSLKSDLSHCRKGSHPPALSGFARSSAPTSTICWSLVSSPMQASSCESGALRTCCSLRFGTVNNSS